MMTYNCPIADERKDERAEEHEGEVHDRVGQNKWKGSVKAILALPVENCAFFQDCRRISLYTRPTRTLLTRRNAGDGHLESV